MAIAVSNKLVNGSLTDAASYNTASVTVTVGRLYLLTVTSRRSTAALAATPTVTGASQTWAEVDTHVLSTATRFRTTVFRCLPTSGGTGALTIDFGGQTQTAVNWVLDEFTGIKTGSNGANAIVQSVDDEDTGSPTTMTVTLAAFASAGNATYGAINVSADVTATGGFTEVAEIDPGAEAGSSHLQTEFKDTPDTTVTWSFSAATVNGAFGIEIQSEPALANAGNAAGTGAAANTGSTVAPTLTAAAAGTGTAYQPTISFEPPPRSFTLNGTDYVGEILYQDFSLTECANRGEVGMGGIDLFDDDSSLDIPALKGVIFNEPAAGTSNQQVFAGFIHDRAMGALQDASLAARMHDVEVTDLNILASDYVLTDAESADRPAETDYVRMAWLMTSRLNSEGGVGVGVIPNTNTVTLEAVDYRGRKPADVAAECSEASGKLWFIYDYGAGPKMYYDLATGTSLPATLSIADDGTADGSTIFAPQPDVIVKKSPDRVYSTVHLTYNEGTVTVTDAAVETAYRVREAAVLNTSITDSTVATAFANALLDASATELVEVEGLEIVVPAANVNDVRAGQYVTLTLSRQGISAADYRVIRRTVTPLATTHYLISLDLASDVLASANGSRGSDIIWPNKSNANDDGATVTIDRGGINVIDGAITVVNSGATVIIDGESDMFRVVATGVFTLTGPDGSPTTAQTSDTDTVATGLAYAPSAYGFVEVGSGGHPLPFVGTVATFPSTTMGVTRLFTSDLGGGDTSITVLWWSSTDDSAITRDIRYYIVELTAI